MSVKRATTVNKASMALAHVASLEAKNYVCCRYPLDINSADFEAISLKALHFTPNTVFT